MPRPEDSSDNVAPASLSEHATVFSVMYRLERGLRPYTREEVRRLPEGLTGVYAIWLPSGLKDAPQCLYVGISWTCVRRRLLNHLSNDEPNPGLRTDLRLFRDTVLFSTAIMPVDREILEPLESAIVSKWQTASNVNKRGAQS